MKGFRHILTFLVVFFGFMLTPALYAQSCQQLALPSCFQGFVIWPEYSGQPIPPTPSDSTSLVLGGDILKTATGDNQATAVYNAMVYGFDAAGICCGDVANWKMQAQASPTNVDVTLYADNENGIAVPPLGLGGANNPGAVQAVGVDTLTIKPGPNGQLITDFFGSYVTITAQVGARGDPPPDCQLSPIPPIVPCQSYGFGLLEQLSAQTSAVGDCGGPCVPLDTIHFDGITNFASLSDVKNLTVKIPYFVDPVTHEPFPIQYGLNLSIDNMVVTCFSFACVGSVGVDPSIIGIKLTLASGQSIPFTVTSASGAFYDATGASAHAQVNGTLSAMKALGLRKNGALDRAIDRAIAFVNIFTATR